MDWVAFLSPISTLFGILDSKKEIDQTRVDEALVALGDAYFSTVNYYESNLCLSRNSRQEQLKLAEKWDRVANLTRRFDRNIASRFSLKSQFWQDGEAWDQNKIEGAKIGLESVRKDARFKLISRQNIPKLKS
jgi:hypothetical protein